MFKRLVVFLLIVPVIAFAQSSGKIAGVCVDKATGEPLPGVNVILEGTTMGSSSDIDGYFVVLNSPVGVYNIRANYIGYKDVLMQNVRVSAAITTEINFQLEPTTLELDEAVVVTADRPLVEKNVTQSVSLVTASEIASIPIRGFNNLIATQNSVIVQDGNVHIRGGRPDEVGYYIDGASAINPLNNTQVIPVIQDAIEEFQVLAGGYTAEFGGANSGIVRTELKTGTSDYHFSFDMQTDKFANQGEKFLNTYSYQHQIGSFTLSGPLLGNKIRFFAAVENDFQGDRFVRFSKGFTLADPDDPDTWLIDDNPLTSAVTAGKPDTVKAYSYPDGFTPNASNNQWAYQGTLLFDFSPLKFRLSGSYSDQREMRNGGMGHYTPMLDVLNQRQYYIDDNSLLLSGKLTYVVNTTSFLEGTVSMYDYKTERGDDYFGTEWTAWYDSARVSQASGGTVTYRDKYRPQYSYEFNGLNFSRPGDPNLWYIENDQQYLSGALNYVTQIGRHHEVRIGADARRYTMRRYEVQTNSISMLDDYSVTNIRDIPASAWISGARPNNYGYDVWGEQTNDDAFSSGGVQIADAPKHPMFGSFYVQDKIEYNDLIINAGLRFDYFDSDAKRLINPQKPDIDPDKKVFRDEAWEDMDAFQQVSPRLGFSFPVSERTVFYLQYGKFIQLPELETMYNGSAEYNYEYIGAGFAFLNPGGYGLDPIRTTSYEIGFRQQLGAVAAFDLSGYYRNVQGQIVVDKIYSDPGSLTGGSYNILTNGDFTTTKGLEFRLTLRRTNRLQGQLNYTLTNAEGSGSTRTAHVAVLEQNSPRPTVIRPLDFSQTHTGSINLDYRFGKNDGGPILSQLGVNALLTFSSGHPFTYTRSDVGQASAYTAGVDYMNDTRSRRALELVGSSQTPWNYLLDLRVDKSINLVGNMRTTLYMRVNNVLNTKNVLNVYNASGSADDDGFINNQAVVQSFINQEGERYVETYTAINLNNGQSYWDQLGLQLWGHPRQIFFGIRLEY